MKINEKNLYTFANSKPVDREGKHKWHQNCVVKFHNNKKKSFHNNKKKKIFIAHFKAIYILKETRNSISDGLC